MTTMTTTPPQADVHSLVAPLAARIRAARRGRDVTVAALARDANLRARTVRSIEAGQRGVSAEIAGRIARALGMDEEELYPGGRPERFWAGIGRAMRGHQHAASVSLPLAA